MSKEAKSDRPSETSTSDAIYYRDGVTNSLAERAMRAARRQMYDLFCRELSPTATTTILDVGVSTVDGPEANTLEKLYPYPHMITCAGLDNGAEVRRTLPTVSYVKIAPGEKLPFADKQFDIAYSNAVLEHVGGPDARRAFMAEAVRVAKSVFLAVPNRWFPIEHHTGLLLLHYSPALFRRLLKGGNKDYWTKQENLDFLSKATLRHEFRSLNPRLKYAGLILGPLSSNVAIVCSSR
jgi:SAM-dependent methyltransferase